MTWPFGPYPNYMLPEDVGKFADNRDVAALQEPLRSLIHTAIVDCPYDGLYLNSGYRTPWEQFLLRRERCGAGHEFDSSCSGFPTTALPYRSRHNTGLAADMAGPLVAMNWLRTHRYDYGLELTVPNENWHFEPRGVPRIRIIPFNGPVEVDDMDEATFRSIVGQELDKRLGGIVAAADDADDPEHVPIYNASRAGYGYSRAGDEALQALIPIIVAVADSANVPISDNIRAQLTSFANGGIIKRGQSLQGTTPLPL